MNLRIPKVRSRRPKGYRPQHAAPPPPPAGVRYRGRESLAYGRSGKAGTRTRAQLGERYDRRPPQGQPVKKTSARFPDAPMGHRAFEGNYPPRGNLRRRDSIEPTRSQLAQRRSQRAAAGLPASTPHPKSGEGARASYRATGTARRPAAVLRDPYADPGKPVKARHRAAPAHVELHGERHAVPSGRLRREPAPPSQGFAARFFGADNTSRIGRPPR